MSHDTLEFQPFRLRLARHFWGATLQELADTLGCTRQHVSQMETGAPRLRPEDGVVLALAAALKVESGFFFHPGRPPLAEDQAHFRKLASTRVSMRQKVLARGTVFGELVDLLETKLRLPRVDLPDFSGAHTAEEIERVAERARQHWGLGWGPIDNMVRVVERAGVVVAFFHDASREVDALSISARRPIIVRNDLKASPFRQRFDIAHELGHLLMHEGHVTGDRQSETEANRFASAFLLPRSTFLKAFPRRGSRLDWAGLSDLKMQFQVSKAAILYRARSLGALDEHQYRGAVITLKNRGEAIAEAEDPQCAPEEGEVVLNALAVLAKRFGLTRAALAHTLHLSPTLLAEVLPPVLAEEPTVSRPRPHLRLVAGVEES